MHVYNIGSINWDHCYQVAHFVRPGETLSSKAYKKVMGGKGANQSVALASSGAQVKHIGALGPVDHIAVEQLQGLGVDVQNIALLEGQETGHAIIQIDDNGENAIILFPGANRALSLAQIEQALSHAQVGDWVLLQNETNLIEESIALAKSLGLKVAFNPAPMDNALTLKVLENLDLLIVNEVELADLAQTTDLDKAMSHALEWSQDRAILVTLGSKGVRYIHQQTVCDFPGFKVDVVDTTAAGDTFIGYFLGGLTQGSDIETLLKDACAAAALCVSKSGAIPAIPQREDVNEFLKNR